MNTPEQQVAHLDEVISDHKKYFIGNGTLLMAGGLALEHFGLPDTSPWITTAAGYGVAVMGGMITALGFYRVGEDRVTQANIQRQAGIATENPEQN